MGSKSKSERKESDNVLIQIPEQFSKISRQGLPEVASQKCPPSIEERLEQDPLLSAGTFIHLQKTGNRFIIMLQGNEIGMLSKRNTERIIECAALGVSYTGKIILKKGEYYGIFMRQSL